MAVLRFFAVVAALCSSAASGAVDVAFIHEDMQKRCADGREHAAAYYDGGVVDLTLAGTRDRVVWDDELLRRICKVRTRVVVAHCHPEVDAESSFPSAAVRGGGDIEAHTQMVALCSLVNADTSLRSMVVDTVGQCVVEYGLRPTLHDLVVARAQRPAPEDPEQAALGRSEHDEVPVRKRDPPVSAEVLVGHMRELIVQTGALYKLVYEQYVRETCDRRGIRRRSCIGLTPDLLNAALERYDVPVYVQSRTPLCR